MRKSYSKIRHIQEANSSLEKRFINENPTDNVVQLAKDIFNFFSDMNIIPGPIDGAKLLYNLYRSNDPIQTIKDFVYDRIPTPGENWKKIEKSMEAVKQDISKFKSEIYSLFKKNFPSV